MYTSSSGMPLFFFYRILQFRTSLSNLGVIKWSWYSIQPISFHMIFSHKFLQPGLWGCEIIITDQLGMKEHRFSEYFTGNRSPKAPSHHKKQYIYCHQMDSFFFNVLFVDENNFEFIIELLFFIVWDIERRLTTYFATTSVQEYNLSFFFSTQQRVSFWVMVASWSRMSVHTFHAHDHYIDILLKPR